MKITHNKLGQNLSVRDSAKAENAGAAGALKESKLKSDSLGALDGASRSNPASKVEISSRAHDIKKAKEIAMSTPDVDEAKVARLQKLIDEGKYKTDSAGTADKMVDEYLKWE